jgi:spore germination protein GerM
MAGRKNSSGSQGGRFGCFFFLLAFCVAILVLLLNLGKIRETLDRTNFTEIVKTQKAADQKKSPPVAPAAKVSDEADPGAGAQTGKATQPPSAAEPSVSAGEDKGLGAKTAAPTAAGQDASGAGGRNQNAPTAANGGAKTAAPSPASKTTPSAQSSPQPATPPSAGQPAVKSRPALLYFVRIDDDGIIVRQEVSRQIPASDQPLTDALAALIAGPSEAELRRHLLSLVPQGTKLLSVQVRGSTAFLNFNEAFMYNHYGIEGYAGQLKQIVYTATAFSSVQDVQILIEGERHDYLGGEGVYIGRPLSRNSF